MYPILNLFLIKIDHIFLIREWTITAGKIFIQTILPINICVKSALFAEKVQRIGVHETFDQQGLIGSEQIIELGPAVRVKEPPRINVHIAFVHRAVIQNRHVVGGLFYIKLFNSLSNSLIVSKRIISS